MAKRKQKKQGWWRRTENWVSENPVKSAVRVALGVGLPFVIVFSVLVTWAFFSDEKRDDLLALAESLYNLGLILAAVLGLPILVWRGKAISVQADAANVNAEAANVNANAANVNAKAANLQAKTESQKELQQRFQKAAEMLASNDKDARLAGIYALDRIARDNPKDYHMQIIQLLCAFIRYAGKPKKEEAIDTKHPDRCYGYVETALAVIGKRKNEQIRLEKKEGWVLRMETAYLYNAWVMKSNFANADFSHGKLMYIQMRDSNISGAAFYCTNLTFANLYHADLSGASLTDADLTNADLTRVKGLTQAQLDTAKAKKDHPPTWKGELFCANTGKDLEWKGLNDYEEEDKK